MKNKHLSKKELDELMEQHGIDPYFLAKLVEKLQAIEKKPSHVAEIPIKLGIDPKENW